LARKHLRAKFLEEFDEAIVEWSGCGDKPIFIDAHEGTLYKEFMSQSEKALSYFQKPKLLTGGAHLESRP